MNESNTKIVRYPLAVAAVAVAAALLGSACNAAAEARANFPGPFQLRDALTFYLVNDTGADFTVALRWRDEYQSRMDRPVLIRVFDPEEHLVVRHDDPGARIEGKVPNHSVDLPIHAAGPGVYQVAVTGFGGELEIQTSPSLSFGVYGSPALTGRTDQFADARFFLPPRLSAAAVQCTGTFERLSIQDEQGQSRLELKPNAASGQLQLPSDGEHVWKLNVHSGGEYGLDFGGLPVILCPDERSARAIHGSVDVLDDGTICFHKFQVRAHEILKRYRGMNPAVFDVRAPQLVRFKTQWLADPARNQLLLGPYGVYSGLWPTLREQNLDSHSPWFGSIFTWHEAQRQARTDNPWTSYTRCGLSEIAPPAAVLAAVYNIDAPFNPLHHDEALRSRVIIAALQELMLLRENELPQDQVTGYAGGERAFRFARTTQAFPWVIRDCPADVRAVWTEGLQRYVDRMAISEIAGTVNQWTFIINGIQHFADGSDDARYVDLVKRHVRWMLTANQWNHGRRPAGYFDESEGPDATYNGITNHNLAWLYAQTNNSDLLEALRQCINLFNHTIAPEPPQGGKTVWLGSSSYCHRTPGDWTSPQFGGGFGILSGVLPEAGPHVDRAWLSPRACTAGPELQVAEQSLVANLKYLDQSAFTDKSIGASVISGGPEIAFSVWEHCAKATKSSELPMVAQPRFTHDFGDEFFCVRRTHYYAFIYAGHPMGDWQKKSRPDDAHRQHPRNGGGLCMFWSPTFGSSVLGKNWSAYAAQTLIAESASGKSDWEDYWTIQNSFDEQRGEARITGSLRDQPVEFERAYHFLEDRVNCTVALRARNAAEFKAMWECFPYPLDKPDQMRVTLLDENGQSVGHRPASAIVFQTSAREAHVIVFDQARQCDIGTDRSIDVYDQPHEYGRVLAQLPAHWDQGQRRTVKWSIMAVPVDQIAATVKAARQRLHE